MDSSHRCHGCHHGLKTGPCRRSHPFMVISDGYLKVRSDIAGNEALLWKKGYVHAMSPGRPGRRLMMF